MRNELKSIFKKFYRTKRAEASGEVGTGIGLSIVEQIVTSSRRAHGSDQRTGKRFLLYNDMSRPTKGSPAADNPPILTMQKLLIVEDDASVRSTMVTCLELEGYAVEAVSSTREAIDRLRSKSYPIVISDIYLDERTGIDVLRTARLHNPDCAVILMSGRGSMETVMAATTEGGASIIWPSRSRWRR